MPKRGALGAPVKASLAAKPRRREPVRAAIKKTTRLRMQAIKRSERLQRG